MVELAIRARFKCEYCGKYLLADVDAYESWQKDHIVPEDNDDISNLAIACKPCNFMKRKTDPRRRASGNDRASLIEAARAIINERRATKAATLQKTEEAARVLMSDEHKSNVV